MDEFYRIFLAQVRLKIGVNLEISSEWALSWTKNVIFERNGRFLEMPEKRIERIYFARVGICIFFLKCFNIENIHFRFFCRFKINHLFSSWNTPFLSKSESAGKMGHFKNVSYDWYDRFKAKLTVKVLIKRIFSLLSKWSLNDQNDRYLPSKWLWPKLFIQNDYHLYLTLYFKIPILYFKMVILV